METDDKVYCVDSDHVLGLTKYTLYTINKIDANMIYVIDDQKEISGYFSYRFKKYDYRKEKLLKIKERICLKSVIQ